MWEGRSSWDQIPEVWIQTPDGALVSILKDFQMSAGRLLTQFLFCELTEAQATYTQTSDGALVSPDPTSILYRGGKHQQTLKLYTQTSDGALASPRPLDSSVSIL